MQNTKKEESVFEGFTNLYDINKTIRFSLIPILTQKQEKEILEVKGYKNIEEVTRQDREEKFFNENKKEIFEVDIERKEQYKKLKYYLTELHKLFIKEALDKIKEENKIIFSELFENFVKFENTNDEGEKQSCVKKINSNKLTVAKFFGDKKGNGGVFQEIAKNYYEFLKKNLKDNKKGKEKIAGGSEAVKKFATGGDNILLSQNVLRILEERIKDNSIKEKTKKDKNGQEIIDEEYSLNFKDISGEDTNLIIYFKGWSTYFKNFNEIRGNLYKDDGRKEESEDTGGEVKIRKANAGQITTRIIDENFEIFVKNFIWADKNKRMLALENFKAKDFMGNLSIFDAKFYVNCLTQEDIDRYNSKIADLNKFFNEVKKDEKKKDKIKYLKPLFKQLLFTIGAEKEDFVKEFLDNNDFINGLEEFKIHSQEKIKLVKDFLSDDFKSSLDEIFLNENQTHFFCNQFFGSWSYFRDLYYQQNQINKNKDSGDKKEFKDKDSAEKTEFSLLEIKELLDGKDKNEFKNDVQKGNLILNTTYKDDLSNFDNFVLFLKHYFDSLLEGRDVLNRMENKDLGSFKQIINDLETAKNSGEKIDELLLKKVSEKSFQKNINESLEEKKRNFEIAFEKFREFSRNKKRLDRESEFEFKKTVNEYCNRMSEINGFFTLFSVPDGVVGNTTNEIIKKFKEDNKIVPLYGAIRNFITKRGDELERVKLNFDNQSLLEGWDLSKEIANLCVILRDNKNYFLCIFSKGEDVFNKKQSSIFDDFSDWQKMEYKMMKDASLSIPKCSTQTKEVKEHFETKQEDFFKTEDSKDNKFIKPLRITKEIFDLNNFEFSKDYLKSIKDNCEKLDVLKRLRADSKNNKQVKLFQKSFFEITGDLITYKKSLNTWINFCKKFLECYPSSSFFDFSEFKNTEDYNSIDEFYKDVDKVSYNVKFVGINYDYISKKIEQKEIYLFQIYNKDFSSHKKADSSENMHTLYFKELFSGENLKEPIFKLSGGAEIFFRPKIDREKLGEKEDKNKNKVIDHKRYSENKILFHLPIVLNNINDGEKVNKKIHRYIQENDDVKILGIDRGEKELAYYCLLEKDGKICGDLKSMNETGSNIVKDQDGVETKQIINYQKKLDIKEKERMLARKSWTKIEGIKDLKKGYISNVVKDIADLMVNNNALVCLEELNYGFKRGRIRIEKSIYQNLENDLVNKLNYLVLEKSSHGIRNALQLTPRNNAQKYWGNQMGAIFYTDAKFTSRTCPNCGFRKRGVGDFDQVENIKEKIDKGNLKVFFEKNNDRFRIEYNWKYEFNEDNKKKEFNNGDLYEENVMEFVYSDAQRAFWNNGGYTNEVRNPNEELKEVFGEFLTSEENLFDLIKEKKQFSYSYFIQIFKSILEIRNTIDKKDVISCPKCHFSTLSDKAQKIKDGDANGAYNISRRGLLIFGKIRSDKLKTKDGIVSRDLKIILKEWDEQTYQQWDKKDWSESENKRGL